MDAVTLLGYIDKRRRAAARPRDEQGRPASLREQLLARIKARRGG